MKSNKRVSLFLTGLSALTVLGIAGATSGTLAWYAYSTRASLAYKGVSIAKTEQLQVGIVDSRINPRIQYFDDELAANNCYRDSATGIVWANPGAELNSKIISAYLSHETDASYVNSLFPATMKTRALDSTNEFSLYKTPSPGDYQGNIKVYDSTETYVDKLINDYGIKIPFVFRVIDNNHQYVGNSKIWVSRADARVATSGGQDISPALRTFFEDPNENSRRFLVNPSSETSTGSTTVAGMLDLDNNGYYDYGRDDSYTNRREVVYGTYEGSLEYSSAARTSDSGYDNVNGTTNEGSFYAKHRAGNYQLMNFSSLELGRSYYYGMSGMRPTVNEETGAFSGGQPVTITGNDTKLGYLNLYIYLEGWDHATVDNAIGSQFNLGLTFEIDRV